MAVILKEGDRFVRLGVGEGVQELVPVGSWPRAFTVPVAFTIVV